MEKKKLNAEKEKSQVKFFLENWAAFLTFL